jgi:hypothetical protein
MYMVNDGRGERDFMKEKSLPQVVNLRLVSGFKYMYPPCVRKEVL